MKVKYLFHPLVLFMVPSAFSILVWILTPADWFYDWRVTQTVSIGSIWEPWLLALVLFGAGLTLRSLTFRIDHKPSLLPADAERNSQWLTLLLSSFSIIVLVALIVKNTGVSGLFDPYTVKANYVGGLTTFTLLTSASLVWGGVSLVIRGSIGRGLLIPFGISLLFALYRASFGAERLAILMPCMAIGVAYLLIRYERITFRMIGIACAAFVLLVTVFIAAEYFRSFSAKLAYGENIIENPVIYGLQRFVLYFSLSVNSGATEFGFFQQGLVQNPLFSMTCGPAATVIYSLLNVDPITPLPGAGMADVAISMGLFNPEFNNRWGVATPFTEGWLSGCLFWVFWGFVGMHLYLKVTKERPDVWSLSLFALFAVAFVDNQSRVGLLGGAHFLMPFLWLLLLRWVFTACYGVYPRGQLQSRQSRRSRLSRPIARDRIGGTT